MPQLDTIDGSGFPLAFPTTSRNNPAGDQQSGLGVLVEARKFASDHQKEAVLHQGGHTWRVCSDEGGHIGGTDLAPFPLGFFNAGLQADLIGRILTLAEERDVTFDEIGLKLRNGYYMTGSFFRGDGEGFAEPAVVRVIASSSASIETIRTLVKDAALQSPALAAMKTPLVNRFAIYVNGRRRTLETMTPLEGEDAPDPFTTYASAPAPEPSGGEDPIRKTGEEEAGEIQPAPAGTTTRIIRIVKGRCHVIDGLTEIETWLSLPGMSHFVLRSDERRSPSAAPSGLALLSAGISFCFMTQLDRYIKHMKFDIGGVRLVQHSPYSLDVQGKHGIAEPVDTHLFLNGHAEDSTYETLMRIAARTCYLHATLAASLEPQIHIDLNGREMDVSI